MKIKVTFEDTDPIDVMVQHMAEQHDSGVVEDWIHGLVYAAIEAHPHYRECSDPECCEIIYPTMTVRPVLRDGYWKRYQVDTAPTETCPGCGKATVRPQARAKGGKHADGYYHPELTAEDEAVRRQAMAKVVQR